ncbi:hypothetical protein [Methylophaga sp.]|uniref:DUF7220 family protein n=1 Tax=Methylophaga sp. TaxID=2024840 RepID=UPI003A94997A
MQSKKHSLVESLTNVLIGYLVALFSQLLIFPFFGIHVPLSDNLLIGLWFTIISIVRSYTLRRFFNRKQHNNPIGDMR